MNNIDIVVNSDRDQIFTYCVTNGSILLAFPLAQGSMSNEEWNDFVAWLEIVKSSIGRGRR